MTFIFGESQLLGVPQGQSGGGGESITVDQTYDATSTNAQSGTAVAEAVSNVTVELPNIKGNGTLTVNDYVFSGFGNNNYLEFPQNFIPGSYSWEMGFEVNLNTNYGILVGDRVEANGIRVYLDQNHFCMLVGGGSWYNTNASSYMGTLTVVTGTDYWVKFGWEGTKYYLKYSTDGENYTTDIEYAESRAVAITTNSTPYIGKNHASNSAFDGSIGIKNAYVDINGTRWWNGKYNGNVSEILSKIIFSY